MLKKMGILALSLVAMSSAAKSQTADSVINHCQVLLNRSDAVDFPSRHAWNLFLTLNHPAVDEDVERGQPDCTKSIGTPGTTSVWETWRNARTEVFLKDGLEPPDWNDNSLPDEEPGTIPEFRASGLIANLVKDEGRRVQLSFHDSANSNIEIKFDPGEPGGVFKGQGGFGETRMNRSTYEFVKRNCLWSRQGMQRYAQAVIDGKRPPIVFDPDSIEAKAAWLDFEEQKIPASEWARYYVAEFEGKNYGLTSLHVITKDIPNWFWATFHHVDAPPNEFETPDNFGRPKALDGTVWENYVLGGTQLDFVTPTGRPTILSDHYVEFEFQRSSCITCHATATTSDPDGPNQPMAMCILSPDVVEKLSGEKDICLKLVDNRLFEPGTDTLLFERGPPLPEWYEKGGKPVHFQTDFVFSIPFRAQDETSASPQRCLW